jgi:hypothetical protein
MVKIKFYFFYILIINFDGYDETKNIILMKNKIPLIVVCCTNKPCNYDNKIRNKQYF